MSENERKILILDDDDMVREGLVAYFEDRSWQVIASDSAEMALRQVDAEKPDCAIVDIRLPKIDGSAFVRVASLLCSKMVYLIYTGSSEYVMPEYLKLNSNVSNNIFIKPVFDMAEIENELVNMLK